MSMTDLAYTQCTFPKTPAQCVCSVWVIVVTHQRDALRLGHPHALRTEDT